jgi:hypothetical protein
LSTGSTGSILTDWQGGVNEAHSVDGKGSGVGSPRIDVVEEDVWWTSGICTRLRLHREAIFDTSTSVGVDDCIVGTIEVVAEFPV